MIPNQKDIEIPLLQVIMEQGGQVRAKDAYSLVADKFPSLTDSDAQVKLSSGDTKWKNRVRFVRQHLISKGELESPAWGIWQISEKGRKRLSEKGVSMLSEDTSQYIKGELVSGRELQTTARIKKRHIKSDGISAGEQFENEIWLLLASLGFSTLNQSRNFNLDISIPGDPPSWEQIDVFAKDGNDHVFVIECKYSENLTNRTSNIKGAIDKFTANDSRIRDSIRKFFGDEKVKRLKISYVIATKNISWSETNLRRARNHHVHVWRDDDIEQLNELAGLYLLIGDAVKYQLYASMFRGQDVRALEDQKVIAIKGKAGNFSYYQFIATPEQLLPIGFVHRRRGKSNMGFEDIKNSYQRMLNKSKVKAIGQFIDSRRYFPNNIIISFDEEPRFDLGSEQRGFSFKSGVLTLPNKYGSAWIIDGQHRLYGFANSDKGFGDPIPVIAFSSLDISDQAKLFVEINRNQTNVKPDLMWDLYGDIYQGSEDPSQTEDLTISNIVKHLDKMKTSPLNAHISIPSHGRKSKSRNITMSTLSQGIKRNGLLSSDILGRVRKGKTQTQFEEFSAQRFAAFFRAVEQLYPKDWEKGDKGYLRTNNGISALLVIFKRIIRHLNNHEKFIYTKVNLSDFEEEVTLLLLPAIEYLRSEPKRTEEFRRRSGQAGQQECAMELLKEIRKEYPDYFFLPIESSTQISTTNLHDETEGDEKAPSLDDLIKETELQLRKFIKIKLKENYGDAWFRQGIPSDTKNRIKGLITLEIRKYPYREGEIQTNIENRLEFSNLGDLKDIIIYGKNWGYFESTFKTPNNVEKFFVDFNDLRNAYRGHMRQVDSVLMARGRAAITWISRCIA